MFFYEKLCLWIYYHQNGKKMFKNSKIYFMIYCTVKVINYYFPMRSNRFWWMLKKNRPISTVYDYGEADAA